METGRFAASGGELCGGVDDVEAQLEALLASTAAPVDLRAVTAASAGDRWLELREWVDWFRAEFAFDHRVVPPCWYRHSALVSVLSALRDHWLAGYDEAAALLGPSDWHRALMQLEPRLREWASRTGCTASVHRPDVVADYPDDAAQWRAHLQADVAARAVREQQQAADGGPAASGARLAGGSPR